MQNYRFVADAYAVVPIRAPVQTFINVLKEVKNAADAKHIQEIGKKLGKVIEELEAAKVEQFTEISAEMYKNSTLKAFLYAEEIGGEAMRYLRNFKGSHNISHAKLFEMISELPIDELTMNPQIEEGLQKVFRDFATFFNKSHGAAHQLKLIHHYIKSNKGIIKGVEVERKIYNAFNESIGRRVDDVVIEIDEVDVIFESKAWSPNNINRDHLGRTIWDALNLLTKGPFGTPLTY